MKVYFCDITKLTQEALQQGYLMLDSVKKAKADRCSNEKTKKMMIASDLLTRKMIAEYLKIEPKDIKFAHSSHGKPILPGGDAHFNVSHSGNYWVGCIDNSPCGVDIEIIRDINLKTAKRFCNHEELKYIENSSNSTLAFLYIWTRKEAYFKSIGCGIATVLSAVDVLKEEGLSTVCESDYILSLYSADNKIEIINIKI